MTCSCGTKSCYVCGEAVKNYTHFCQTPHCQHTRKCTKCPLYTNAEEDDERAMREAGVKAAQKASVEVDVDSILKGPPRSPAKKHARK
jgi:hypothetical protein